MGSETAMDDRAATAARYRRFAADEARGRSPLYERLSDFVANDAEILDFLLTLPEPKRQPNLLLAAFRHLFGVQEDAQIFRATLLAETGPLRALMLARATQTNEPGRCATLLPLLATLPQPLALLEVGASAGLCLLPDFYSYDFNGTRLGTGGPLLPCAVNAATPIPTEVPQVVWRAGLDLNPLDAADPEDRAWLECLVWPEQTARRDRLRAALDIAAVQRPRVVQGDLLSEALPRLAAEAPRDATLVIFHTAVLAYLPPAGRAAFAATVKDLCHHWISNEAPGVMPWPVAAGAEGGQFVMAIDGAPCARTDPHGARLDWLPRQGP
ncbi:DUF2332 domain-containing protein [Roseomonas sp. 18066]|uniref:DUF2332 domain-containing protein n=1 Tax=Roseomonas sp. 18066 TaxID=2681412 RepID=UPI00190FA907|nr:DUF2332 domain-containing protein [Roseomonas sp. 18066]